MLVLFETGPIAILVQDEVRPGIQTSLDVYLADLANEGYRPIVVEVSKTDSCQIIRTILQGLYSSAGIEGAVLIGDIEVAKYLKFSLDYAYTDLYYMDLDGMWIDENGDGIFDLHTGNKEPEIWVGRLDCATLSFNGANQVDLLNAYLLRNHNYRSGVTHLSEKALIFLDDDDQSFGHDTIIPRYLDPVFWQKVLVSGHDSTDAEHYSTMLGYTYGLIWVGAHSVATAHYFTSDTGYSIFRSIQLPDIDPQTPFYFVDGCSTGGFE
ncbi:MAG: C25 family cysteine peptidase, partial [candidate division WOR-3 bacterium]